LSDLFDGTIEPSKCVAFLLSLRAPEEAEKYLVGKCKAFPTGLQYMSERWQSYPTLIAANIKPITEIDINDSNFVKSLGEKLSFDISRFIDFIEGYALVAEDIKPVMLHYSVIYLLDFFSRTWLNYGQNNRHGLSMIPCQMDQTVLDTKVKISENGVFQRSTDAFFVVGQSSLFSKNEEHGIGYLFCADGTTYPEKFTKLSYASRPQITLRELFGIYNRLNDTQGVLISAGNKILAGYLILFLVSSISRYRARDWFEVCSDRNLINRVALLCHDFISKWIPELLLQQTVRP